MNENDQERQISENSLSTEEEEIIELVDKVAPGEDEEIIDLTDKASVSDVKDKKDEPVFEPADINIPIEQLETVLERVIDKMFSEKAERLLAETIEKAVTKEIEKLKRLLLED